MPTLEVKTIKSAGGDFTSLHDFNVNYAGGKDLVSRDVQLDVQCYSFLDTVSGNETISGWTTDATRYVRFYTPSGQRHRGYYGTGYRIQQGGFNSITIQSPYFRFEGIAINGSLTSGQDANRGFDFSSAIDYGTTIVRECFIGTPVVQWVYAPIRFASLTGGTFYIVNNIIYSGKANAGTGLYFQSGSGYTAYFYNNTIYGFGKGSNVVQRDAGGTIIFKNTLVDIGASSASSCFSGSFDASSTNNLSSDGTAPGSSAQLNASPKYTGPTYGDFRLDNKDTAAIGNGADLSGDSIFPFSTDIDGETRTAPWFIGAGLVRKPYLFGAH